jgi:hypothetical protein
MPVNPSEKWFPDTEKGMEANCIDRDAMGAKLFGWKNLVNTDRHKLFLRGP